jgi:hypothetical protein
MKTIDTILRKHLQDIRAGHDEKIKEQVYRDIMEIIESSETVGKFRGKVIIYEAELRTAVDRYFNMAVD